MNRYSLDDPELRELFDLPFEDYPVDEKRTDMIDRCDRVGKGFQGSVCGIRGDDQKVAKLFRVRNGDLQKDSIIPTYYAAMIGVGPQVHGRPFLTPDRKNVVVIMDKVTPYRPTPEDVRAVIDLYKRSIDNKFMTFDSEFARTPTGKLVFIDFGVSYIYKSPRDALQHALDQGFFENAGVGYYHPDLEAYFKQNGARRRKRGSRRRKH